MRTAAVHQYRQRINDAFRKFTSRESFACQNGVLRRTGVARLGRLTSAAGKQPSLSGSRPHHHQPGRFSPLGDCLRSALLLPQSFGVPRLYVGQTRVYQYQNPIKEKLMPSFRPVAKLTVLSMDFVCSALQILKNGGRYRMKP